MLALHVDNDRVIQAGGEFFGHTLSIALSFDLACGLCVVWCWTRHAVTSCRIQEVRYPVPGQRGVDLPGEHRSISNDGPVQPTLHPAGQPGVGNLHPQTGLCFFDTSSSVYQTDFGNPSCTWWTFPQASQVNVSPPPSACFPTNTNSLFGKRKQPTFAKTF